MDTEHNDYKQQIETLEAQLARNAEAARNALKTRTDDLQQRIDKLEAEKDRAWALYHKCRERELSLIRSNEEIVILKARLYDFIQAANETEVTQ